MNWSMWIIISVLSYLIVWVLFRLVPWWWVWLLLMLVFLVIKDISLYAIEFRPLTRTLIDWKKIQKQYTQNNISSRYYLALLNRTYFFPIILSVYLWYLLIQQTHLRDLDLSIRYLGINETALLLLTILSWIFLVYQEEKDTSFQNTTTSLTATYVYYLLSVVLWWLSAYIIYKQVHDLWTIWDTISVISWVLVFLVWILLMEEEPKEK